MQTETIRIGTRGSPLALKQAEEVRERLTRAHDLGAEATEICVIKTSGDRIQDRPLRDFGGKGLFTKEIEAALLGGEIDMAVHSMKDVETVLPDGLVIACILAREDVRDGFISLKAANLAALPAGGVLGTASLRRQAQVRRLRPDLEVVMFRGNIQTRMRKLEAGEADATFLAAAGLHRMGNRDRITSYMSLDDMLPAVGQGAIGVEVRAGDERVIAMLAAINDAQTTTRVGVERAFLARLDGSCRTPIAGLATLEDDELWFRGEILTPDGARHYGCERRGPAADGERMGADAADELLGRAGSGFFDARG